MEQKKSSTLYKVDPRYKVDPSSQSSQISVRPPSRSQKSEKQACMPLLELRVVEYFLETCMEEDKHICEPISKIYKGYKDSIETLKNDAERLENEDRIELKTENISNQMLTKLKDELTTVDKKSFILVLKKKTQDDSIGAHVEQTMLVGAGLRFWRNVNVISLIKKLRGEQIE